MDVELMISKESDTNVLFAQISISVKSVKALLSMSILS